MRSRRNTFPSSPGTVPGSLRRPVASWVGWGEVPVKVWVVLQLAEFNFLPRRLPGRSFTVEIAVLGAGGEADPEFVAACCASVSGLHDVGALSRHFGSPAGGTNPRAIQSDSCANGNVCLVLSFDLKVSEGKGQDPVEGHRSLLSAAPHPSGGRLSPNWGLLSVQAVPRVCFSEVVAALRFSRRLKGFLHPLRPRREQRGVLTTRKTPLESLGKPFRMHRCRYGLFRDHWASESRRRDAHLHRKT